MSSATITIKNNQSNAVLAAAKKEEVTFFEGSWYFDRHAVDMSHLVVTERIYICPYKGRCYWIDLNSPEHQARNVAWIYFEVKEGYQFIKDRIGFYAGRREATVDVELTI